MPVADLVSTTTTHMHLTAPRDPSCQGCTCYWKYWSYHAQNQQRIGLRPGEPAVIESCGSARWKLSGSQEVLRYCPPRDLQTWSKWSPAREKCFEWGRCTTRSFNLDSTFFFWHLFTTIIYYLFPWICILEGWQPLVSMLPRYWCLEELHLWRLSALASAKNISCAPSESGLVTMGKQWEKRRMWEKKKQNRPAWFT